MRKDLCVHGLDGWTSGKAARSRPGLATAHRDVDRSQPGGLGRHLVLVLGQVWFDSFPMACHGRGQGTVGPAQPTHDTGHQLLPLGD